ncbi:hypothetical protein C1O66_16325 [Paucibacter aquatile]|uniref:Beta-lactamase-related domain-containing protein n=2 Tax=Kinneretia aquatilis TaxID=2070761 RepID=A0A2N8KZQ9_9BURK|nr:hypothetical protein C1O66_16325 [Paucibacter aquatile]
MLAGLSALGSSGCASRDLRSFRGRDLDSLAAQQGICLAHLVTLKGAQPQAPRLLGTGCGETSHGRESREAAPPPFFQAVSLTKPAVAYLALQLVREGLLDLDAPLSRYLAQGYLRKQPAAGVDAALPAATLVRTPLRCLLNHSSGLPNWASSLGALRLALAAALGGGSGRRGFSAGPWGLGVRKAGLKEPAHGGALGGRRAQVRLNPMLDFQVANCARRWRRSHVTRDRR